MVGSSLDGFESSRLAFIESCSVQNIVLKENKQIHILNAISSFKKLCVL